MSEATSIADPKSQFELLYGDLRSLHEAFVDGSAKMVGFQIIVLGWLITSENVASALKANASVCLIAAAAILISGLVYVFISLKTYRASRQIFGLLCSIAYMPQSHFRMRVIKRTTLSLFLVANLLVTFASCFVVSWYLHQHKHPASRSSPLAAGRAGGVESLQFSKGD